MKSTRSSVGHRRRVLVAGLLACGLAPALAAVRAPCTPRSVSAQAGDGLSLSLDAAHPSAFTNWEAGRWQRHRVWISLEANNLGDAPVDLLPQMIVDARADGGAASVLAGVRMTVAPHARATQRLAIYVTDDAKTLGVRTSATTPAPRVDLRLALECSDDRFGLGQFAPAVAPVLDEAVKTYFNDYVDPLPDPAAALAAVRVLASGAQDADDIAWTMRGLMQTVRDDHGFVVAPGEAPPAQRRLPARAPELELRTDGVAVLRLHGMAGGTDAEAIAWASRLHDGIAAIAARHPRAWLVDLRDCDGDNPWPAFAALSALLDGPAVGAYVTRQGRQDWIVERGVARIAGEPALVDLQSAPEPSFRGPVAVLIGANTRDFGEDVTVAFRGRLNTRFFGAPTAGFPFLGVQVHRLADGTSLGILQSRDADRTGLVHRLPVEPDTVLRDAALLDAIPSEALDWLLDERQTASPNR